MIPAARLEARTSRDHTDAAIARARHGARRATTNAITRSGWFVGLVGGLLALQVAAVQLFTIEVADPDLGPDYIRWPNGKTHKIREVGVPYQDGPCAGKISCPELGVK